MNNKGFAISGFVYTIFIIFIGAMIAILSLFNSRKNILDNLKDDVLKDVNKVNTSLTSYNPYTVSNSIQEFTARTKGFYQFTLKSPKIGNTNGSTVQFEIFMTKGETLYILIGSSTYNNGTVELRLARDDTSSVIASASYNTDRNFVAADYRDRVTLNTKITSNDVTATTGSVTPNYLSKAKKNDDLNRVQYIKDCINGNVENGENSWSEVIVLVDGANKSRGKNIINGDIQTVDGHPLSNITDGNTDTFATLTGTGEQCIVIDLERTYNIDTITILHKPDTTYYDSKTYVSSDNVNYKLVRYLEEDEGSEGLVISSYEDSKIVQVGNVYVPIKEFEGAKWLRLMHHNNLNGTLFWDSLAQTTTAGGYDDLHKKGILYNIAAYKNKSGQFEFLLEYSDIDGYNRWIQTSNPVDTTDSVTGYKAVKVSWNGDAWYGLAASESGNTLLDGNKGISTYYPVGVIMNSSDDVKINSSLVSKASTDLWVRIDNIS